MNIYQRLLLEWLAGHSDCVGIPYCSTGRLFMLTPSLAPRHLHHRRPHGEIAWIFSHRGSGHLPTGWCLHSPDGHSDGIGIPRCSTGRLFMLIPSLAPRHHYGTRLLEKNALTCAYTDSEHLPRDCDMHGSAGHPDSIGVPVRSTGRLFMLKRPWRPGITMNRQKLREKP